MDRGSVPEMVRRTWLRLRRPNRRRCTDILGVFSYRSENTQVADLVSKNYSGAGTVALVPGRHQRADGDGLGSCRLVVGAVCLSGCLPVPAPRGAAAIGAITTAAKEMIRRVILSELACCRSPRDVPFSHCIGGRLPLFDDSSTRFQRSPPSFLLGGPFSGPIPSC
jgi:hypothetical protein